MKKIFYFLGTIFILLLLFHKPLTIFFLEKSLTHSLKRDVEITTFSFSPLKMDATIKTKYYKENIDVHVEYLGGLSLFPKSIGKFLITSTSLGGLVTIDYEHYTYNVDIDSVDFKKVAQVLNDKKNVVQKGVVNGTIVYHKKQRDGVSDIKVTEVVLKIPNIDQTIASINDAVNFNMLNLFSRNLINMQPTNGLTYVDHLQFDVHYKNKKIIVKDVALRTKNYRISLVSKVDKKGKIDYFYIHLLDKNGCVMVTQELQNTIKKPKRTTSTSVSNVVQASPKSFFNMGQQMMKYGSSYAGKQTGMSEQTKQMTSYVLKESGTMFETTSKMVLDPNCEVIYKGKVKDPLLDSQEKKYRKVSPEEKTDLKNTPTLYRQKLLL